MNIKEDSEKAGLKLNIQKTKIKASGPITSWQIDGEQWKQWQTLFFGAPKSLQMVPAAMRLKETCSLEEKLWPTWIAYSKAETLLCQQSLSGQSYGFSSSPVWMWELDYKESQALKNWCFWNVVLEKTLESPLACWDIKLVNPKGSQS